MTNRPPAWLVVIEAKTIDMPVAADFHETPDMHPFVVDPKLSDDTTQLDEAVSLPVVQANFIGARVEIELKLTPCGQVQLSC